MHVVRWGSGIVLMIVSLAASGQESVTQETNSPTVKWYQLNTPNFRVLYPKGFDVQAQRVANTLETIREPEGKTMGAVPKKISVILQNQSSVSNGFVTLAPRRSEFYAMPSQNYNFMGNNDWLSLLSSHEYRHMVQFQRSVTGFNKFISYLFGQQAVAGFAFAAAPQWFWEGDAVATETAFTQSGRGRIKNFDMLFRTNLMEGRTFNYHKQYLRSYKHNIPNHYVLGYNMVSYLRKKTGDPMIWEKVTGRSWAVPFIPFAFSNALKKETGLYVKDLYAEMARERKQDYEKAISGIKLTPFESITPRKSNAYTDYSFPQPLDNGKVVAVKSGIGDIEQLVVLSQDGKEEERYVQGVINDAGMLSATNQRVVWNEFRYDPRWLVRNYTIIKGYDFGSKQSTIVSRHSRYSAAALSPDGYRVATIETTTDYKVQLVILDYFSGKVLASMPNPDNDLLAMPRWNTDGKSVVALRTNAKGKTITRFDISQSSAVDLIPFSDENIGYPVPFQNYVFYNSPVSGIDNIYALNLDTQERYQVTSSKYGAYNAAVSKDGKVIYYNDQMRDGLDVVKIPFDPAQWKKVGEVPPSPNDLFEHLVEQEGNPHLLQGVSQATYEPKRYHRAQGMINPHSWGPYFVNSLTRVNVGIASQDILSTTSINAGYTYDVNEKTGYWKAGFSYQGQYPIWDFSFMQATRTTNEGDYKFYLVDTVQKAPVKMTLDSTYRNIKFSWNEKTIETGLRVPLVTTTSKYYGNVTFLDYVGITQVSNFTNNINNSRFIPAVERSGPSTPPTPSPKDGGYFFSDYIGNGSLYYNHFSLSAYRLLKRSRRDINSKWGQSIDIDYFSTPYGGNFSGAQFSVTGMAFVPGFMKHHSIWGYWSYEKAQLDNNIANYTFRNQIPLPRGQSLYQFRDTYSMSANYTLPLWYPDIAAGPLLNLQRVRANLFFDYAYGAGVRSDPAFVKSYTTVGAEVKIDLNVMRFLPQFNVGFRYSYGINPSVRLFEVLIGSFNF